MVKILTTLHVPLGILDTCYITPGSGPGKDAWWLGEDTVKQTIALLERMARETNDIALVLVFDNSTGHGVYPKDALDAKDMNLGN